MLKNLSNLKPWQKLCIVGVYDICIIMLSIYASVYLRFGDIPHFYQTQTFIFYLLAVSFVQFITFYFNGLYRGMWRYSSIPDLVNIIKGVSFGVVASAIALFLISRLDQVPRTIFFVDWLLLIFGLSGGRVCYRIIFERNRRKKQVQLRDRVLIIGAGARGEMLLREIQTTENLSVEVAGFIDDNRSKKNRSIRGVKVIGNIEDLEKQIPRLNISHLFISIHEANDEVRKRIYNVTKSFDIKIKALPSFETVIKEKLDIAKLRKISAEDLLGRETVHLNYGDISNYLTEKVIMITGGGGSIGSELCNQICKFNPTKIVIYELTELFLFNINNTLLAAFPDIEIVPVIGDVRNPAQVDSVIKQYLPDVIFHAAAYKHVPLMESNPFESVRTNVLGTFTVATMAAKNNVGKFVLISTDKAVNPTNVMGATKKIAELVCQSVHAKSATNFVIVRFGNVLGSSGSVIPLFKQQIADGGPVTVTHKDITRFFMSIPEASQLVVEAAAVGKGGEIFVLDMGEPVKIYDLAKQMIKMAGMKVGDDIEIEFTGLRPGEKMFEELFSTDECSFETKHKKIRVAKSQPLPESFEEKLSILLSNSYESLNKDELIHQIINVVNTFSPDCQNEESFKH
jgi:FlaA1/EpsC-like NDP-sugar epimerase